MVTSAIVDLELRKFLSWMHYLSLPKRKYQARAGGETLQARPVRGKLIMTLHSAKGKQKVRRATDWLVGPAAIHWDLNSCLGLYPTEMSLVGSILTAPMV